MSVPPSSLRVLIVDDEPSCADTLAIIVGRSGHQAVAAYSGIEARNAAKKFKPHVLLSDVRMPGMSGVELAIYFAEHFPDCKLLLMTGNSEDVDLTEANTRWGRVLNLLAKPVRPQTILDFLAGCAEEISSTHGHLKPAHSSRAF